jgi:hypothetical protein
MTVSPIKTNAYYPLVEVAKITREGFPQSPPIIHLEGTRALENHAKNLQEKELEET